jgi:hypothetical protein
MKSGFPQYRFPLRVLAGKLAAGSLTKEECLALVEFLRALADGQTVEEVLGVKNPPHRPKSWELEQRIFDVAVLQLPKKHGGSGLKKDPAIEEVAKAYHKAFESIADDYKSERGKKIRAMVKANYYNPFADDAA